MNTKTKTFIILLLSLCSCNKGLSPAPEPVGIVITVEDESKSDIPANAINDINIYIYDENGFSERHIFRKMSSWNGGVYMMPGKKYSVMVVVNAGYDMGSMPISALMDSKLYINHPDGSSNGMLMSGAVHDADISSRRLEIPVKRMMAKVSVKVDKQALDKNVEMYFHSARIGNCPRSANIFRDSRIDNTKDLFPVGFSREGDEKFELYLLENLQGGPDPELASYVELFADYISPEYPLSAKATVTYRFYLRENDNCDVRRNCHYHVTVCPRGNGLSSTDEWRVSLNAAPNRGSL